MPAIFCIPPFDLLGDTECGCHILYPNNRGLQGYKIWQPLSVSPSYAVSPQLGGVMGGGRRVQIANTAGQDYVAIVWDDWDLSQASQLSLSEQLLIRSRGNMIGNKAELS